MHALFWLLIGYSDGVIYYLMEKSELTGYLIYLMPVFILYIVGILLSYHLYITKRMLVRQAIAILLYSSIGILHTILIEGFYVEGYAQLCAMVSMILLLTDLFADNADTLRPGFAQAMLMVHGVVCGYIILSWLVLRLMDVDISLFIHDSFQLMDQASLRTSGLHREPAWAGYAVASSYLAVHLTRQSKILAPQILFLVAVAATGSGSGLVMAALFIIHQIATSRRIGVALRLGLLGGLMLLATAVFGQRIMEISGNSDVSVLMRTESSFVAFNVIKETFPLGTGFGNYRDFADFDQETWGGFINLGEADYYKSDIFILNTMAELGFLGCIIVFILMKNFYCRRSPMIFVFALLMMVSSGTLVIPSYLVLAAIAGLEIDRTRRVPLPEPTAA